jgi:hypothetical protein
MKRFKTKVFWVRVWHYSRFKFDDDSRKQLSKSVPKEDWLPILTSLFIGILSVVIFVSVYGYLKK